MLRMNTTEYTAWDLIGYDYDSGPVRVKGGRALYEAVMYNDATPGSKVKLARLDTTNGLREVSRYVDPDTRLEIVHPCDCMPEDDPATGWEKVMTHSGNCPLNPEGD